MNPTHHFLREEDILLAEAIHKQDTLAIENFIRQGVEPNTAGKGGLSMLMWALAHECVQSFEKLLQLGADPNQKNAYDDCVVSLIAPSHETPTTLELLKLALAHGANPNATGRHNSIAFIKAAEHGNLGHIQLLLASGANLNQTDRYARSAWVVAKQAGHIEVAHWLEQQGAECAQIATPTTPNPFKQIESWF